MYTFSCASDKSISPFSLVAGMRSVEASPRLRLNHDRTLSMEGGRTLVVADLHLGYEDALEGDGLHLPRTHTMGLMGELLGAIERQGAERVVVLGDVKHDFHRGRWECRDDVRAVISMISECCDCVIVRGNHDNYIQSIVAGLEAEVVDSIDIDGHRLEHGHASSVQRPLIIGHEHPSVRLFDRVGGFVKIPCFLHHPVEGVTVLPAFSPMAPGNDLCNGLRPELFSPALAGRGGEGFSVFGCSDIGILPLGSLEEIRSMRF